MERLVKTAKNLTIFVKTLHPRFLTKYFSESDYVHAYEQKIPFSII